MTVAPSHVGLCVSDLDAALRFYCDGLGLERAERYELTSDALAGLDRSLEVPAPGSLVSQMIVREAMEIELLNYTSPGVDGVPSASSSTGARCSPTPGRRPASTSCSWPIPTAPGSSSWRPPA